ncbi:hypothetical protein [Flavobacterium sp. YO64]|uniref:hypothetical protein n=1 Tax=Flavobacterium sp. YO64 TaxID=394559 RepID=UPI00100AE79B|nr:hypothetical protein [Flavobacterium sp. YO64]RXM42098.1 hypothetical protein BOW57_17815 [Flavobacterium sp. YO64]
MDYKNLIFGVLFAIGAFGYYKMHKWWLEGRDSDTLNFKPDTSFRTFKNWVMIIGLAITSIIFFLKAL